MKARGNVVLSTMEGEDGKQRNDKAVVGFGLWNANVHVVSNRRIVVDVNMIT